MSQTSYNLVFDFDTAHDRVSVFFDEKLFSNELFRRHLQQLPYMCSDNRCASLKT